MQSSDYAKLEQLATFEPRLASVRSVCYAKTYVGLVCLKAELKPQLREKALLRYQQLFGGTPEAQPEVLTFSGLADLYFDWQESRPDDDEEKKAASTLDENRREAKRLKASSRRCCQTRSRRRTGMDIKTRGARRMPVRRRTRRSPSAAPSWSTGAGAASCPSARRVALHAAGPPSPRRQP
ncbi:MAG: hypothetical protein AB7S98_24215 [Burkholderiaceae bacterium]